MNWYLKTYKCNLIGIDSSELQIPEAGNGFCNKGRLHVYVLLTLYSGISAAKFSFVFTFIFRHTKNVLSKLILSCSELMYRPIIQVPSVKVILCGKNFS